MLSQVAFTLIMEWKLKQITGFAYLNTIYISTKRRIKCISIFHLNFHHLNCQSATIYSCVMQCITIFSNILAVDLFIKQSKHHSLCTVTTRHCVKHALNIET